MDSNQNENPVLAALAPPSAIGPDTPGATPPGNASPDVSAAIAGATVEAVREHNAAAGKPKRPRGRPRIIPLAGVDSPAGEIPISQIPPASGGDLNQIADEEAAQMFAESVVDGMNDVASFIQGQNALRFYGGDQGMKKHAEQTAKMSEGTYKKMMLSGKILAKRYLAEQAKWAPEGVFGVTGILWLLQNFRQYKHMEADHARNAPPPTQN